MGDPHRLAGLDHVDPHAAERILCSGESIDCGHVDTEQLGGERRELQDAHAACLAQTSSAAALQRSPTPSKRSGVSLYAGPETEIAATQAPVK